MPTNLIVIARIVRIPSIVTVYVMNNVKSNMIVTAKSVAASFIIFVMGIMKGKKLKHLFYWEFKEVSMEINEAIKRIEDHMCVHKIGKYPHVHLGEALDLAIVALKEKEKREHNPKLTLEDLQQLENKFIWWDNFGGLHCQCKKGFVVTEAGTFSFDFVLSNGSVYFHKPNASK